MALLEVRDLRRDFGANHAVAGITFDVAESEIFGLLGPNGAGKTTTLKILTTLLPPTSGRALVAGYDIDRQPARARRVVGYVPQMLSADGNLSARENLNVFAKLYGLSRRERRERVEASLATVGLSEVADRLVRTYSGGMIRRLEIAQAMLHRPALLFLDEPTVGLDPTARRAVWHFIRELRGETGTAVLLTTHMMDEAEQLCDRVAIMDAGTIAVTGAPRDLIAAATTPHATLDDVFAEVTGSRMEQGGGFRDTARARRVARRLG